MSSLTLTTFLLAVVEDRCQCVGDSGDDDQHGDLQIRCRGCPAGENRLKCKSRKENRLTCQQPSQFQPWLITPSECVVINLGQPSTTG